MKPIHLFSIIYVIFTIIVLNAILGGSKNIELIVESLLPVVLIAMYLTSVQKEHSKKLYILMLIFTGIGQIMFVFVDSFFTVSILFFSLAHLIFINLIYKNYLKNQSSFDIFTFSLPFLFIFSVAYVLYDVSAIEEGVKVILAGIIACFNASLVLLNYANKRSVQNYLFFIAVFIWLVVDALAGVYVYSFHDELYYLLTVLLNTIAQYMICRAFILDGINEEDFLRL